jgi:septation ring formation regulator EzrA
VCDTTLQVTSCYLQLQEYLTQRIHESEATIGSLSNGLDEFKKKLEESNSVNSDLKRQLQAKDEVLKSNDNTQKQLQATLDSLTKTVESLNQRLQVLCEPPKFVSTWNIPALTVGPLKYLRVSGTSNVVHTSEDFSAAIIRISFKG